MWKGGPVSTKHGDNIGTKTPLENFSLYYFPEKIEVYLTREAQSTTQLEVLYHLMRLDGL